jgi:8-oxo-dGTP pyrophosphatase MutT (NUDIX family)
MTDEERRRLVSELRRVRSGDPEESRDIEAAIGLLTRPDAASRSSFVPGHITASAFVIHLPTGRILLHHHRRLDKWLQLGGHLEPGESPVQAALREAEEESGLAGLSCLTGEIFDVDVHPVPAGKGEPDHRHFDLRYVVIARDAEGESMDPQESVELSWMTLDEAWEKMASRESRRAITKLRALLSPPRPTGQ